MQGKGDNRLYAFVNFRTKELALKAIQKLNNKDLKVCFSSYLMPTFFCHFYIGIGLSIFVLLNVLLANSKSIPRIVLCTRKLN
jgi:hypothetical protein